ncbi:YbaB/EbfC family nucleoid-associated protein [Mycolicibacterium baixiangningiae]|uniref:YbaB/EbfC family nucleoid-associated protein n=1 Tax=Mycolicibacterium baixiangningiae TaxID=2761578 RepID=UPI00186879BF|nr:YbaB/EbfC family nucleoid-associated protein [Mycolicibacterium baixiangningiae]
MRDRVSRASGDRPPEVGVEDALHRARRRAFALDEAIDALAAVRGRARSADGVAEVVVDGRGGLVSLTLTDAVALLPAKRIAALVLETVQAAAHGASAQRHAVLDDLVADLGR